MDNLHTTLNPDLIEQIPEPQVVSGWLAETLRRADLLRALLRVAKRKAAYRPASSNRERGERCAG